MISIFLPRTLPPKSSAAICAATTEPIPLRSEYRPDMSARTPIFTTSFESCACAYVPWRQREMAAMMAKCTARRERRSKIGMADLPVPACNFSGGWQVSGAAQYQKTGTGPGHLNERCRRVHDGLIASYMGFLRLA